MTCFVRDVCKELCCFPSYVLHITHMYVDHRLHPTKLIVKFRKLHLYMYNIFYITPAVLFVSFLCSHVSWPYPLLMNEYSNRKNKTESVPSQSSLSNQTSSFGPYLSSVLSSNSSSTAAQTTPTTSNIVQSVPDFQHSPKSISKRTSSYHLLSHCYYNGNSDIIATAYPYGFSIFFDLVHSFK